jgi:hypothetical protein
MGEKSSDEALRDYLTPRGGTAFPVNLDLGRDGSYQSSGLTARDWFATHALMSILPIYCADNKAGIGVEHVPRNCAAHAYALADAMLAERAKP